MAFKLSAVELWMESFLNNYDDGVIWDHLKSRASNSSEESMGVKIREAAYDN